MKKRLIAALMLVLIAAWALHSYAKAKRSAWNVIKNPETVQMLKSFVAVKKAQAYADTNGVPPEIQAIFKYAEHGDWQTLSNLFNDIKQRDGWGVRRRQRYWGRVEDYFSNVAEKIGCGATNVLYFPRGTVGAAITEIYGALDGFVTGDEKYSTAFGQEIIDSIPPGSIYFGGSDPGRSIVPAMCKSQLTGDPFFTLSLNSLRDMAYLDNLRSMYGSKIYIPTEADSEKCFEDYRARVEARYGLHSQTNSIANAAGRDENYEPSSTSSINDLLCKVIFNACPTNEFFIEESYPITWMHRRLEPHGMVFKINRQPLAELSDEIIQRDRDYWTKSVELKIGGWLTDETSIETVAAFAKKVFLKHDLEGFIGDARFVQNEYSCKMFSRERSCIAGLYAWRANHSANDSEKRRMTSEADFAFRQAWALCPDEGNYIFDSP
jgi:hypothetical protein